MKKFKNLVIGGIQQKVFNLVLVTILLLVAAYTAVIVYQSGSLKKLTAETNQRQKEAIAEISETTMDAVVADSLTSKAEMAAMLADDLFVRLSSTVKFGAPLCSAGRIHGGEDQPAACGRDEQNA